MMVKVVATRRRTWALRAGVAIARFCGRIVMTPMAVKMASTARRPRHQQVQKRRAKLVANIRGVGGIDRNGDGPYRQGSNQHTRARCRRSSRTPAPSP